VPAARRPAGAAPPTLVEVTRGEQVESRHRGTVAVVAPSGELVARAGDPEAAIFLRSTAKPFQLAPFVASGRFDEYGLGADALAIMAASHSGEDRHVRTVQAILRAAGIPTSALACGTHTPYDTETARRLIRDGEPPTPLRHNCSGKHAGMLLFAKASGWPLEGYWQPDHPVQRLALETVSALTDHPVERIITETDGCGVVTFGLPLRGLATAYARLADPSAVADRPLRDALVRIRDAMMQYPELVAGERRRVDTALMRSLPGVAVSKGGAEGVQAVGLLAGATGRDSEPMGVALAIEDGDWARGAVGVAISEVLRQLDAWRAVPAPLVEFASIPILDPRGSMAGVVRPGFTLR
jgi:L-asparaginase II